MDDYATFGVMWYWIIDPSLQSLEIFELTGARYARVSPRFHPTGLIHSDLYRTDDEQQAAAVS
jgi:Uma2 family endonuclease